MSVDCEPLKQHLQQLMNLREGIEQVKHRKRELTDQLNALSIELLELEKQFRDQKQVLEHCLNTGDDPLQVQLVLNKSDLKLDGSRPTNNVSKRYHDPLYGSIKDYINISMMQHKIDIKDTSI